MKKIFCTIILGLIIDFTSCQVIYGEFGCHSYDILGKPYGDCFGDGEKLILPNNIARNVQELHMEAFFKSSIAIQSMDTFNRFANLSVLDIRTGKSFHIDENLREPDKIEHLRRKLFYLPNLETLILQYEEFNEENNSWVLPPNLKELHLHHSVFEFDIHSCSVLEKLIITNNKLTKIPPLGDPPPPLKVLSLSYENSLNDLTVNDIAPLCQLQRLELVMYADEEDRKRKCECFRLQEWLTDLKLEAEDTGNEFTLASDVFLRCPQNDADCWNYTLDDARRKRDQCLWTHYGIIPKSLKKTAIVAVLILIVLVVVMITYNVHCFGTRPKLIYLGSVISKEYYNCTFSIVISEEFHHNHAHCSSISNESLLLPQNIPKNIHILLISSHQFGGGLMIEEIDTFSRFADLIQIKILLINVLDISENLLARDEFERLRRELFNLPGLLDLGIFYFTFNSKNRRWILPESLVAFQLSNSVFEFDLSRCAQLKKLLLNINQLNEMPILSNPPPSLIELDLSHNPLSEFVANDVAEYCDLTYFSLVKSDMNYCECVKLIEWIKLNIKNIEEFKFEGVLECNFVEDQTCSENMLRSAEVLRDKCVDNSRNVIPFIVWIMALFAIAAMIGFLFAYVYFSIIRRSGEE